MPPTEAAIEEALEALRKIRLETFSAEPASVLPGNPVELKWRVAGLQSPLTLKLNGAPVQASGTQTVIPFRSRGFTLEAAALGSRQVLGNVQVAVDLTGCSVHSLPEGEIRTQIRTTLEQLFPSQAGREVKVNNAPNPIVRVRNHRTQVRARVDGLRISGELGAEFKSLLPDGTITFDATIALGAEGGRATHKIVRFGSDFDYDDKLDFFTLGIAKIADKVIDAKIDDLIRDELDQAVGQLLATQTSLLSITSCELVSVSPAARRIDFTLCPSEEGADCTSSLLRHVIATDTTLVESPVGG